MKYASFYLYILGKIVQISKNTLFSVKYPTKLK